MVLTSLRAFPGGLRTLHTAVLPARRPLTTESRGSYQRQRTLSDGQETLQRRPQSRASGCGGGNPADVDLVDMYELAFGGW